MRLALQRATIHLVTSRDCLALRPMLQPALDRNFFSGSPYGRRLKGLDLKAVLATGRALVEDEPRTPADLGRLLQRAFPGRDAYALSYGLRNLVALVQVPPRGLWETSGQTRHTTAESWLGRKLSRATAPDGLVLRYLGAFGPASVRDAQQWSGLAGLQSVFDRLAKRLRLFQDDRGTVLYDLPRAARPDPDTPAPVRLLPEYDNIFLSHVDRRRILGENKLPSVGWNIGSGIVLVDGFMCGAWRAERTKRQVVLRVRPATKWSRPDRLAVEEEAERLLAFLAPDAPQRDVTIRSRR